MTAFNCSIQHATAWEHIIWKSIQENPNCASNTLAYQFHIPVNFTIDSIQNALYYLLTHGGYPLNYRFFERSGELYKQYHAPSMTPVKILKNEHNVPRKKKFSYQTPSEPLYVSVILFLTVLATTRSAKF